MKSSSLLKQNLICLSLILFTTLSLHAQSTKNVSLSNFSAVSVSAGIELYLTQGNTESAKILANEDVINEVEIKKSGSSISVGWKDSWGITKMWKNKNAKVYISYKNLNRISASSGSSIKTVNALTTERLNASVSSGATMNAAVSCKELELEGSSGASVVVKGMATNTELSASSGSSVDALDLNTEYARVNTSSGADVRISVSKALETHSSSGGNIRYRGNAALKNTSNSRNSGVSRIN